MNKKKILTGILAGVMTFGVSATLKLTPPLAQNLPPEYNFNA